MSCQCCVIVLSLKDVQSCSWTTEDINIASSCIPSHEHHPQSEVYPVSPSHFAPPPLLNLTFQLSWTVGELVPTSIRACLIQAFFLPRTQPSIPPEFRSFKPDFEAAWSLHIGSFLCGPVSYLWNGGNIIPPKVEWNHLCKVLSTGHVSWGLPSACVSQDCAWPRRWDHPPRSALRELHLDLSAPWASRAHLWNQANFFSHILSAKGQGSPFSPESLGWGPSMPTPIATLQSSTAQQNFLGRWNCSVSVLCTMEANSHKWLLRTWNVVSTIKE